jgi:hypothetical protein
MNHSGNTLSYISRDVSRYEGFSREELEVIYQLMGFKIK